MNQENWQRIEYETWDEAFRGLVPVVRQQSVRVAAYTKVLYTQACAASYGSQNPEWQLRVQEQHADLAYKCALYHMLGKALLPPTVQVWRQDMSLEEKTLYRSYPMEGRFLVSRLQDKKNRSEERPTNNIAWLMVRESCEQHMERWDGSGFPDGRVGDEISPIAQIVGLAKELDRLVCEIKSVDPFADAYVALLEMEEHGFSKELIEVLRAARGRCRAVYKKYIRYTRTIPKTIPLVERHKDRVMGLSYRQIGNSLFEAFAWYKGVLGEPDTMQTTEDVEEMLIRTNTLRDVMFYFLYEATDTLLHIQNAQLDCEGILVSMPPTFFRGDQMGNTFEQLLLDQEFDTGKLLLGIPAMAVSLSSDEEKGFYTKHIETGMQLVLDNYRPELLSIDELQEIGFSFVRISDAMEDTEAEQLAALLKARGISLVCHGAADKELSEEELIQGLLAAER